MIKYTAGYKYRLEEDYLYDTGINIKQTIHYEEIHLFAGGQLKVDKGFSWDGSSGPTIDSDKCMRPSLLHDCLYRLMQVGKLARSLQRRADDIYYQECRNNGMWKIQAWWRLRALRRFGVGSTRPEALRKVMEAP